MREPDEKRNSLLPEGKGGEKGNAVMRFLREFLYSLKKGPKSKAMAKILPSVIRTSPLRR